MIKRLRTWWNERHERWEPVHPWLIFLLCSRRWTHFKGDSSCKSKKEKGWRDEWPWVIMRPTQNGKVYEDWYFVVFWVELSPWRWCKFLPVKGIAWCKLLPIKGKVAARIGNGPIDFVAIAWWGGRLILEVEGEDLAADQVPDAVTKT